MISLLFSSTVISPSVIWFSSTNAETTWYALCSAFPLPQIVLPSIAITPHFSLSIPSQSYSALESSAGLIRSNTRRNVSLSGMPFGRSRNVFSHFEVLHIGEVFSFAHNRT